MLASGDNPHTSLERLVRVEITADKSEAYLVLSEGISPDLLIEAYLHMRLDEAGVVRGKDRDTGVKWVIREYLERGAEHLRQIVLRGTAPVHGIDAHLEMLELPRAETAADGHYSRGQIDWVPAGTTVARIIPAVHGKDGVNVLGELVPAKPARALTPSLDHHLELRANGDIVTLREGRLIRKNNRLRIDSTVVIAGNVDFSTGNVVFPGNVIIEKGVRDCFSVRAKGSIKVRDLVDAATLDADGSMLLEQGIAAREKGPVRAGKDLRAKYMTNVRATAGRDAEITKELNNCELLVGRRLRAPNCSVIRGHVTTGMACELGELGCESGGETTLELGECPALSAVVERLTSLHELLQRRLDRDTQRLTELRSVKARGASHAEELTQLEFAKQQSAAMMQRLMKAVTRVAQMIAQHTEFSLTVRTRIYPGATVRMGPWVCQFNKPVSGPLRITTDGDTMPVLINTLTGSQMPLNRAAKVYNEPNAGDIRTLMKRLGLDFAALTSIAQAMRAA
jgi:uncharacterized protein (DUF342 family)